MLRRIALVSFAIATGCVCACGHEITPEPTHNDLAHAMQIRFRTVGPMNLTTTTYAIVINTCGAGPPYAPEPQVFGTSFQNYSYAFLIGAAYGQAVPMIEQFVLRPDGTNALHPQSVQYFPTIDNFIVDSDGNGNEFELTFPRDQLDDPIGIAQPCPNIVPAGPTPKPPGAPTATAAATPFASATTQAQQYWYFNFFTIQGGVVQDSLGIGGAQDDTTYDGDPVDTNVTQSYTLSKPVGGRVPSDSAAQIQGGEIDNTM